MELRDLRLVVALADELHFGRAADRLHVGQPALSQQLRRIERRLGVQLFDRSTHHVRLTAAGHAFVVQARPILTRLDELTSSMRAHRPDRHLRVGSIDPTYDVSVTLMAHLGSGLPGVTVTEYVVQNLSAARTRLREKDIDLYLGIAGGDDELDSLPLRSDRFGLWVGEEHPFARRTSLPIAELDAMPLLVDPDSTTPEFLAIVERLFERAGAELRRTLSGSGSMLGAVYAVARGGPPVVATITSPMPPGVAWVPFDDEFAHDTWHVMWRRGDESDLVGQALEVVRRAIERESWVLRDDRGAVITDRDRPMADRTDQAVAATPE